jgi:HEAT repeat protein
MQSESAAKRWRALEKLNRAKSKSIDAGMLSILLKALADDHPFVRWQAGLALASQADGSQKLVETLKSAAATTSPETTSRHIAAADALAASQSPAAYSSLIEALGSYNTLLRQSAAEALAGQKNPEAIPHLIKVINDSDPWVRRAAVYALGHLGNKDAARFLITRLRDQAMIVRRSAAYALGALRAEVALPQLKISLTDKDPLTRRNAAWALGRIGLPEAVPELTKLLNDSILEGTIAATAAQAIQTITKPRWLQILLNFRGRF